jgi:hypothetical protein
MVIRTVDQMHAISIFYAHASRPWKLASRRLDFECDNCLMDEHVRSRIHIFLTIAVIFPYPCFGKKSNSLSNTECRPDVLLKHSDGCKLEQFEASRHRGRSGSKVFIVRTDDALEKCASGQYIMSSGQLQWIQFFWLVDCAEFSGRTLNSGIPV